VTPDGKLHVDDPQVREAAVSFTVGLAAVVCSASM
jgi:hypothetical protein